MLQTRLFFLSFAFCSLSAEFARRQNQKEEEKQKEEN